MENPQDENAFPIQIRHDVDGWFFLPVDFNKDGNAWLYRCPHCNSELIVTPLLPTEPEEIQPSLSDTPTQEIQPKEQGVTPVKRSKVQRSVESEATKLQQS